MGPLTLAASLWCAMLCIVTARAASSRCAPRASREMEAPTDDVLLIRPCAGLERRLDEALASTAVAAPPGARVRFAIATHGDPARAAVERACRACADAGIDAAVVITSAVGPNLKADQLARVIAREPAQGPRGVVVVADSDVFLTKEALSALLHTLAPSDVGAVWAPPVEVAPATGADRASAAVLDASLHAFAVLAQLDPDGMVGKLFAVRASVLSRAGGMAALAGHLGEDLELGRRVRGVGFTVRVAPAPAASLAAGRSTDAVIDRYARWITVIRAQRPHLLAAYPLLLAATPLVVALATLAALREGALGLGIALVAVVARVAAARLGRSKAGTASRGSLVMDAVLADALLLAAFARAVTRRDLRWRGTALRIERGGRLARLAITEAP